MTIVREWHCTKHKNSLGKNLVLRFEDEHNNCPLCALEAKLEEALKGEKPEGNWVSSDELEAVTIENGELKHLKAEHETRIGELTANSESKDEEIAKLKTELQEKYDEVKQLQSDLEELADTPGEDTADDADASNDSDDTENEGNQ